MLRGNCFLRDRVTYCFSLELLRHATAKLHIYIEISNVIFMLLERKKRINVLDCVIIIAVHIKSTIETVINKLFNKH